MNGGGMDMSMFDEDVRRAGTNCVKWDGREKIFGREDAIPLWVADMDFRSPGCVKRALLERVEHGVFGYPFDMTGAKQIVCEWEKKRHGLNIENEMVLFSPGVVDSLYFAVQAFSEKGDSVALQPPVYGPFLHAIEDTGRKPFFNPLKLSGGKWRMDLNQLEDGLKQGVKLLLLCSPHNPVGRIWTREELTEVSALCRRYGCRIVTDEIHADFELPGNRHIPMLNIDPEAICFVSSTKTFNLAGLRCSSMLFGKGEDRDTMDRLMNSIGIGEINILGVLAQSTAYAEGAPWLDELLLYLDETRRTVEIEMAEKMPSVGVSRLEGTYLMWLDMKCFGMSQRELEEFIVKEAGVALSSGTSFCPHGEGFMRMNIATPRKNVLIAIDRMSVAFKKISTL
ncbi:MAG: hypothetical protein CW338_02795 [Clostridiales bacterium]|nr:hypothetical protein [Clostridiales bacterium]